MPCLLYSLMGPGFSRTRRLFPGPALWIVLLLILGCAVVPPKKEVAVEAPPPKVLTRQPAQEMELAEEAFRQGNMEEASERYKRLVMDFPQSREALKALLRQGEIDFRKAGYTEAVSQFQTVINRAPTSGEANAARLWLLRCYQKLGRFNDTVESGRSLISFLPEDSRRAEAAELVGDASAALSKHVQALRWYARAYSLVAEDRRSSLEEKARGEVKLLDREAVLSLLTEYSDGFPNPELQTRMAEIETESGKLTAAQERLGVLIERQPQHPLSEKWKTMAAAIRGQLQVNMRTVGCLLPLSGRYRAYGDQILRGIGMAAQDFGVSEGDNQRIGLVVKDSEGGATVVAEAVRDLVKTYKVAAILGPLSRVAAEAAAEEAEKAQVPIITLTQKQGITEIGSYVFRDFLTNEQQVKTLVEYAVFGLGYRHFAILYPQDSYGARLMNLFWDELDRLGAEVRGVASYETSQTDFAEQIKKLVGLYYPRYDVEPTAEAAAEAVTEAPDAESVTEAIKPQKEEPLPIVDFEAIFIPDGYEKVGLIAPQLAYHDVTGIRLLGTNLWNSPKLLEMAAPYLQEAVLTDGFFPDSRVPATRSFIQRFQQTFGVNPGYPEAQGYDTMHLLMEALGQPDMRSRAQLRDALLKIHDLPGVCGVASVSLEGEVDRQPILIAVQRRHMEEISVDFEALEKRQSSWKTLTGPPGKPAALGPVQP